MTKGQERAKWDRKYKTYHDEHRTTCVQHRSQKEKEDTDSRHTLPVWPPTLRMHTTDQHYIHPSETVAVEIVDTQRHHTLGYCSSLSIGQWRKQNKWTDYWYSKKG